MSDLEQKDIEALLKLIEEFKKININGKRALDTKDIVTMYGISNPTLWRWIADNKFPPPTISGKPNKWLISVIIDWETAHILKSA
jgi:predicted DNA-binding transcriptional regulator AlpA